MMENMENVNSEDQNVENMESVNNENEPLEDDFYYENGDELDLDSIQEIEPIEIPNMSFSNNAQEDEGETPQIFENVPSQEEQAETTGFDMPQFSTHDMDQIVEELDRSEMAEDDDREYSGASFDDMFDSLYNDVEGANHFISNLIDQKKNVSENETELAEMRAKLEQEKADFAKQMETQKENIRMEKIKCDEYIKTQKIRLQNEESQFNADVEATRTELNLGEQSLKIAGEKLDTEKSQFEKYKELEEEKLRNDRIKLQSEMEQFEKYKALEEEKIKEENITLNSSREQFDKERENALEKIETGKKELETEKEQFARYKEVEEKKLEHESKNLSQSCARFKELVAQFNSGFQKLPDDNQ